MGLFKRKKKQSYVNDEDGLVRESYNVKKDDIPYLEMLFNMSTIPMLLYIENENYLVSVEIAHILHIAKLHLDKYNELLKLGGLNSAQIKIFNTLKIGTILEYSS